MKDDTAIFIYDGKAYVGNVTQCEYGDVVFFGQYSTSVCDVDAVIDAVAAIDREMEASGDE